GEDPETRKGKRIVPRAGISLRPILAGGRLPERPLFFEHEGNRAIRLGKWKLVWTNFDKRWELYDIKVDRSEINDL
ncbi:MAG: arylsulfatase, partial [Akkermansiaceae bacterium]|nr:arylsulfatase [Akkermansiaceae bacterium]